LQVVEHGLVQISEAGLILTALDFRHEVNLLDHHSPQNLELSNRKQLRHQHFLIGSHVLGEFLLLTEEKLIQAFEVTVQVVVKLANVVDELHSILLFDLLFAFEGNHTIVVEVAVVAEQTAQTSHDVVHDQLVEALQKDCAQVLVQEVDVSKTEHLLSVLRIPRRHVVEVEASVHLSQDISQ